MKKIYGPTFNSKNLIHKSFGGETQKLAPEA